MAMEEISVTVAGQPARVFVGGEGVPLLLIHGGWGGALMHWAPVWDRLAERYRVIAPDLPGIGRTDQQGLGSLGAYERWMESLLDALDVQSAWIVGNSFGASLACRIASDRPDRCRGLVLVDGIPMPVTPGFMRWLGARPLGHRILRAIERRVAYSRPALDRGFSDPSHVPTELRELVTSKSPPQVDTFVDILVQGGAPASYRVAPLLLCGADDRLLGTTPRAMRKLHASWPGSTLAFVPKAGHMPQVENPNAFADALCAFVTRSAE